MAAFVCLLLFIFLCKCISYKGGVLRKEKDARLSLSWMSLEPSCSLPALVLILVRYLSSHSLTLSRTRPLSLSLSSTPTHLTFSGGQTHTLTLAFFVFHSLSLSLTHSIKKFVSLFLLSTHTYSHTTPFSQQITHSLNHHLQPSATSPTISLYFSSSHTQPTKTLFLSLSLRM